MSAQGWVLNRTRCRWTRSLLSSTQPTSHSIDFEAASARTFLIKNGSRRPPATMSEFRSERRLGLYSARAIPVCTGPQLASLHRVTRRHRRLVCSNDGRISVAFGAQAGGHAPGTFRGSTNPSTPLGARPGRLVHTYIFLRKKDDTILAPVCETKKRLTQARALRGAGGSDSGTPDSPNWE
jgi:hypothetical protein